MSDGAAAGFVWVAGFICAVAGSAVAITQSTPRHARVRSVRTRAPPSTSEQRAGTRGLYAVEKRGERGVVPGEHRPQVEDHAAVLDARDHGRRQPAEPLLERVGG